MKEELEIICSTCGKETFVKKEPIYDGFKRVGEKFKCVSCGHVFEDKTQIPFKKKEGEQKIFKKEQDIPKPPKIFTGTENARLCRYCKHYVVNPFVQRCGLLQKEIEATDTCDKFKKKQ
jgi:hypothetical protein